MRVWRLSLLLMACLIGGIALFFALKQDSALPFDRLFAQLQKTQSQDDVLAMLGKYGMVDELAPMQWRINDPDHPYAAIVATKEFDGKQSRLHLVLQLGHPDRLDHLTAQPEAWSPLPGATDPLLTRTAPAGNFSCGFVPEGKGPKAAQLCPELSCFWIAPPPPPSVKGR